jgi:hypothetical protein
MITLVLKNVYEPNALERRIEVPDFPYTARYCQDGGIMRISLSPVEWESALGDIKVFLSKFNRAHFDNGIDRMNIIHDELGLLATWYDVLVEPYQTSHGVGVELSALAGNVKS